MSDFIDDPEPTIPAPSDRPEPVPPADPGAAAEFTEPATGRDATRPLWESAAPAPPTDTSAPAGRVELTPPADSSSVVERYRPAAHTERPVKPLEPVTTAIPDGARKIEPVPPPPRTYYYPAPAARVEAPKRRRWPLVLLALFSGFIGALLVGGGLFYAGVFDEDPEPAPTTAAPVATAPPGTVVIREVVPPSDTSVVAAAVGRKVVPSIVTVQVGSGEGPETFAQFGSGSGVVFREDGLILTNHHVIEDASSTRVIFQDGRIYEATVMGSDELTDLAVLKIEAAGLVPVEFGSTAELEIGERAIAVGNPLGLNGGASLTVGVVSAFDREVVISQGRSLFGMLQTDAPITNGSSGGALVDAEGKLIGITTAIGVSEAGAEGIGFATPVEVVNRIVQQIIDTGDVAHAFLGVTLQTNFEIQEDGATVPSGAVIIGFAEGSSAAEDAGLLADDVVLSWNGNRVRTTNDLVSGIRSAAVGDTITLEVDRAGEILTFDVELGERPEGV